MKILVAEDEPVSRQLVESTLRSWGFDCRSVTDGAEAWEALQAESPPNLLILDWMMPQLDGVEVVRRLRESRHNLGAYVLLLTARASPQDVVRGLEAGADDYVTKPFHPAELRARVQVGVRILAWQEALATQVRELGDALARLKRLQGPLPICSYCKKIRDARDYWQQVDAYLAEHSEAAFSHGICPDCYARVVASELKGPREER